MMTVREVSRLTGISVRALQYYDEIGLLPPTRYTEAGYRLYDDAALERLQQILLFRELEFPLKEIRRILESPAFDRNKALEQQIELLTLKREHIDNLILMARNVRLTGGSSMEFEAFDKRKLEEYAARAKASWGATPEYREFEKKSSGKSPAELQQAGDGLMALLAEFGAMKDKPAGSPEVQAQTAKLRDFISANYYECSAEMLASLGQMYASDGRFRANIDKAGGEGTAEFVNRAIAEYCRKKI